MPDLAAPPPDRRRRRRLRRWGVVGLSLVGLWLGLSWYVASVLTARRSPAYPEPPPSVPWGTLRTLRLTTTDGESLGAWYHEGLPDGPSVLLLHGNGGSRRNSLERAEILARDGCSVLLITHRAHGDSSGSRNDIGWSARFDVIAGVGFLERTRPGRPIIVAGCSLGGAAAAFAAGELGPRVAGYVLESPYKDLRTAVWNRVDNALPTPFDLFIHQGLLIVAPLVLPDLDRISPYEAVASVPPETPILILGGLDDRMARPEEAEALRSRAAEHCVVAMFPDCGHAAMSRVDPDRYRSLLLDFVAAASSARTANVPASRRDVQIRNAR